MTLKTAVLIPCYNEEKTVKPVVELAKKTLPDAKVYVYDNNSTDDTAKSRHRPAQSSAACPSREKAALYAVCSQTLTLIFTLLRTET